MFAILSPAKNFQKQALPEGKLTLTKPVFPEKTEQLVTQLQKYGPEELADVMKMSLKLGEENYIRFQSFYQDAAECYVGLLAYQGEAFRGLDAGSLSVSELVYAEQMMCVLSGLYGVVRPLDEIHPYRLEMQTQFKSGTVPNLYLFWKEDLTNYILQAIEASSGEKVLVNVASQEYSKALDLKRIEALHPVLHVHFKEQRGDKLRVVSMYAKRARGLFIRYMIQNQVTSRETLQDFSEDGYIFRADLSTGTDYVFSRVTE